MKDNTMEIEYIKDLNLENPIPESFEEIAINLMTNYCIKKEEICSTSKEIEQYHYEFLEIEFYLYTLDDKDNKHPYPRKCKAGQWFIHYSGFDIAFESKYEDSTLTQFGGILVRSLKRSDGEVFAGPLRCLMEVFNYSTEMPGLERLETPVNNISIKRSCRIGIKDDQKTCRYYRDIMETSFVHRDVAQYQKEKGVISEKKYSYKFDRSNNKIDILPK